jgi:hypothetical protein
MVESEGNKGSQVEDVNVICQRKEETQRKNDKKKLVRHENEQEQKDAP